MAFEMSDIDIAQAAHPYTGKLAWPTVLTTIFAVVTYLGVMFGAITGVLPGALSFIILSYFVYVVYTPLHEAVHNNIVGPNPSLRWLNKLIGFSVANILGVSFIMHKYAHTEHHRHTNVPEKDPDLGYGKGTFYDVLTGGVKVIINEYRMYFSKAFPKASKAERRAVIMELFAILSWRIALLVAGFPLETFIFVILTNVVGVTLLGTIFAWIVHTPYDETERFKNTNTILLPSFIHKPLTLLWLWQNYHSIHHLYPRVPFYNYSKLYSKIESGMKERGAPIVYLYETEKLGQARVKK